MNARDFVGYGEQPPAPRWPGNARIAVNVNLNFEAGGERHIDHGDGVSESSLNDIGTPGLAGLRSPLVESVFEYGSRVGVWRLLELFRALDIKVSVLGVVAALQCNRPAREAFLRDGHEIVCHGYRWLDYQVMPVEAEREHVRKAVAWFREELGLAQLGWMTGRPSANTRALLVESGAILYDRDALNDERPYWVRVAGRAHLVVPYSFETNDNRFNENAGFNTALDFETYLRDCFDVMYDEGERRAGIMSIALHDRLIGRPARFAGLKRFLEYARRHDKVWFCTGRDIAEHWMREHPAA